MAALEERVRRLHDSGVVLSEIALRLGLDVEQVESLLRDAQPAPLPTEHPEHCPGPEAPPPAPARKPGRPSSKGRCSHCGASPAHQKR